MAEVILELAINGETRKSRKDAFTSKTPRKGKDEKDVDEKDEKEDDDDKDKDDDEK